MKVVSAAIIINQGRIFIAQRPDGKSLAHFWELPGGKLEEGETIQQCAKREIQEELGGDIIVGEHFMDSRYDYDCGSIQLQAYFCELCERSQLQALEHENTAWVTPQELANYNFAPADCPIIEKLKEMTF